MVNTLDEPNCDLPWDIYLDYLADQGFDQLREIPVELLLSGDFESCYYHNDDFYENVRWKSAGTNELTWAADLEEMENDKDFDVIESYILGLEPLPNIVVGWYESKSYLAVGCGICMG